MAELRVRDAVPGDRAEAWGRTRGATVALLDTYARSELSVPFWERRMGYAVRSLVLRKQL